MLHFTGGTQITEVWDSQKINDENQTILWWRLVENCNYGLFTSVLRRDKSYVSFVVLLNAPLQRCHSARTPARPPPLSLAQCAFLNNSTGRARTHFSL